MWDLNVVNNADITALDILRWSFLTNARVDGSPYMGLRKKLARLCWGGGGPFVGAQGAASPGRTRRGRPWAHKGPTRRAHKGAHKARHAGGRTNEPVGAQGGTAVGAQGADSTGRTRCGPIPSGGLKQIKAPTILKHSRSELDLECFIFFRH